MQNTESFLQVHKQNNKLPIRISTLTFGNLSEEITSGFGPAHRKEHYFLIFMLKGVTRHGLDLQQLDVKKNELLFILPHQIHQRPTNKDGADYYKLRFDDHCLSLLPRQYSFLINPFNNQKITFNPSGAQRVKSIFAMLTSLLSNMNTDAALIVAHLNCLLTEMDAAYYSENENPVNDKLSKYINFKLFVENHLTDHITVEALAEKLTINSNSLYSIVKHYSGLSPKEFINNRLILEAKRRLYYNEITSIKELAYALGFNDPEYFSRLFKKINGKSIARFVQDLSGK